MPQASESFRSSCGARESIPASLPILHPISLSVNQGQVSIFVFTPFRLSDRFRNNKLNHWREIMAKGNNNKATRREFLAVASASTVLAHGKLKSAPVPDEISEPLPSIKLGDHTISRILAGYNPIGGYSYLGPHMNQHMKEYFTVENTTEFLLNCFKAGITAQQFDPTPKMIEVLQKVREKESRMKFLCLLAANSRWGTVDEVVKATSPFAVSHHGGATDTLFRQGKQEVVHDFIKKVHDQGLLAGVSAHNPDNIKYIADAGWENDFFMTCFHYLTRYNDHPDDPNKDKYFGKPFSTSDPVTMTRVVREVDKPCLGFKILAAGRAGFSRGGVEKAFKFAFENIKKTDGVIVGMYPRFKDEISENARLTSEYGKV